MHVPYETSLFETLSTIYVRVAALLCGLVIGSFAGLALAVLVQDRRRDLQ